MQTSAANIERLQLPDREDESDGRNDDSDNTSGAESDDPKHRKETTVDMPDINWKEKNFPPGVNLIHFRVRNLHGRIRNFSQKCYWGFVCLVFWWFFNIITCTLQWAI